MDLGLSVSRALCTPTVNNTNSDVPLMLSAKSFDQVLDYLAVMVVEIPVGASKRNPDTSSGNLLSRIMVTLSSRFRVCRVLNFSR